ncbi:MAG: YunG family protein [Janthinobacterium lividum]
MTVFATPIDLYRALATVWAADTASPAAGWSATTPARNHCSVTSLVVQDHFGGEILQTATPGGTHFYNLVEGRRWDLTVSQFAEPIAFDDVPASRAMALADTSEQKYALLVARLADMTAVIQHAGRPSLPLE